MKNNLKSYVTSVEDLIGQIKMGGFTDGNGHHLVNNKAYTTLLENHKDVGIPMYYGMDSDPIPERLVEAVEGKRLISYGVLKGHVDLNPDIEDITELADLIDPDFAVTPTYMTEKAVGADCFASEGVTLEPWTVTPVPTGIKAKFDGTNEGLFAFVRSSIPKKKGLILANGVGVIEEDYYGNPKNDGEIGFMFLNFTNEPVTIQKFERVGQLVITPIHRFENAGSAGEERGDSGSTGK